MYEEDYDLDALTDDEFDELDDDVKDEVVDELRDMFMEDPDEALSKADELGIGEDEMLDNL